MALIAIFGPMLAPYGLNETDLLAVNMPPSVDHWFGTDSVGRDVLSRVLHGARLSLLGPLLVTVIALAFGVLLAVSAAWIGGKFDSLAGVAIDMALAFPGILLAILITAFVGPGMWAPVLALAIANIPYVARLLRAAAIGERSLAYIDALFLQGFTGPRVSAFHLVPNMSGYIASIGTLTYGYTMVDLAALSFLGLGVQPPATDWGSMVAEGKASILEGAPYETLAAGCFIVITVVAVNLLGEALADRAAEKM